MRLPRTPPPPVPPTVVGKLTSCSPSGNTAWPDSENPETAAGSGGLSGLAIAGIVVGVLLTIMQLAVLFYCLFRAEGHRLVDPICVETAETVAEKAYNPSASITRAMATRPTRTTWQLNHEQPGGKQTLSRDTHRPHLRQKRCERSRAPHCLALRVTDAGSRIPAKDSGAGARQRAEPVPVNQQRDCAVGEEEGPC